jgi:hypothetical protein
MIIPTRIRVGLRRYDVLQPDHCAVKGAAGAVFYQQRVIEVALRLRKRKRTPAQRSETFWHEVTHAVLHDMKHPLAHNERFVTAFAKRLSDTINSARFE